MMIVRAMPVTSWIRCKLTPAAAAARITSSRRALACAQARSSVSTECGEYAGSRSALLTGAVERRTRGATGRAGPRGVTGRAGPWSGSRPRGESTPRGWSRSGPCSGDHDRDGVPGGGPGSPELGSWWRNVRAAWRSFSFWVLQQPAGSYPCSISHAVISCWASRMDSASTPTAMAVPSGKTIRQVTSRCGRLSRTSMGLVVVSTLVTSRASLSTRAVVPGEGQRAERPAGAGLSDRRGAIWGSPLA